jgi:hypothetical protein
LMAAFWLVAPAVRMIETKTAPATPNWLAQQAVELFHLNAIDITRRMGSDQPIRDVALH